MGKRKLVSAQSRSLFPDGYRVLQGKQEFVTYPDDSTIRVWRGETPDAFAMHWHTAAEILMVQAGECVSEVQDGRISVRAGEVLFTPPRCVHSLSMGEGGKRCLILFETNALEQMRDFAPLLKAMASPLLIPAGDAERTGLTMTLNQIVSLYRFHEPMWNTMCYSLLLRIFGMLGRSMAMSAGENLPEAQSSQRLASSPQVMESVLGYIGQNYMNDITLEQMADFAGYSKWYFARIFSQYAGAPFAQYLTKVRVNNVRQMLVSEPISVKEIFERSGFPSVSTFNRVFKEANGCTPSEYRAIYSRRRKALDAERE